MNRKMRTKGNSLRRVVCYKKKNFVQNIFITFGGKNYEITEIFTLYGA